MAKNKSEKNKKKVWLVVIAFGLVLVLLVVWLVSRRKEAVVEEPEVPEVDPREELIREQTEALEEKMKDFEPLTEEETQEQTKALEEKMKDFGPLSEEETKEQSQALEELMRDF